MRVDPEYLRQHYGSLSDEELLATDRAELTETAQRCYDAEVTLRGLARRGAGRPAESRRTLPIEQDTPLDEGLGTEWEQPAEGDKPEWLSEAAEVYSFAVAANRLEEERVTDARQILEAAAIPYYVELIELTVEEKSPGPATHRWRLLTPEKLSLQAMSTLERDISNPDFEAGWKTHLEACSDEELPKMHPEIVFCGLFDRMDRVTQAYAQEMARRGLKVR